MVPEPTQYGRHLAAAVRDTLTGPLRDMTLQGRLTPELLREGAARCETDARLRRKLADELERDGSADMTVLEVCDRARIDRERR